MQQLKSILFISVMNGAAWGGSEELWYKLAKYCCSKGIKTGVVCFNWPEKTKHLTLLENNGATVYQLQYKRSFLNKIKNAAQLKNIPFEDYDLHVVNQGGWMDITVAPFKKLYRRLKNYVLLFHNYDSDGKLSAAKKQVLYNWMHHAKLNVGASHEIFRSLEKNLSFQFSNTIVLPNPVTFAPPSHAAAYPPVNEDAVVQFTLLTALDVQRKAQDCLIHTLAAEKWKLRNWQLNIYGNGPDEKFLNDLIVRSNLRDKFFLHGHTNNVKEVLQQCHWLFQCTYKDAMPISVVEAMAMGRPCLVSAVGDMPVWIKNGETGFVCAAVTPELLDAALEKIWLCRSQWSQFGANAYKVFKQKYPLNYEEDILQTLLQAAG